MRLTVGQAVVRFLAAQCSERDGVTQPALRRLLRHLRPRQRRRRRPGAAGGRAADSPGALPLPDRRATSRAWCTRPPATPGCATGCPRWPAPPRSARARRTWSPARRWRPSTGCRCCCCPATSSPPGSSSPVLQELEDPGRPRRHRQRRVPAGVAVLRPGQAARAAAGRAARRDAGAHRPGRDRRGHARAAAGRAGARRTTGRTSCSPSGSGTSPRPVPEPAALARAVEADPVGAGARCSSPAAASSTARRPTRCARSPRRPASRSPRPRPARARCPTTTRCRSARSARPAPPPPTRSPREADVVIGVGTRYSDFTTASRTAFARRRGAVRQRQRRRRSTRASTPAPRWSPTPGPALRALTRRAGRLAGRRRAHRERAAGSPPSGTTTVAARVRPRARPAAGPVRGDRRGQRRHRRRGTWWSARPARCRATCTSCGAPATPRATTSSTATPAWATRSPAGSASSWPAATPARPRRRRHGRRRLLPDDGAGARHRRPGGRRSCIVVLVQNHGFASIGALSESLGSQRFGTRYRYRDAAPAGSTATCCRSTWPPTPRASAPACCARAASTSFARRSRRPGPHDRHHGRPRRDRPAGRRRPAASPGGTCRWPRCRALESTSAGRRDAVRGRQGRPAPRTCDTDEDEQRMRTIEHWIGGAADRRRRHPRGPVWNPATGEQQAEVVLADPADVDAAVAAAAEAFEEWSQTLAVASGPRCCSRSASWSTPASDELAEVDHRRARQGALRRARRGAARASRSSSSPAGIPQLLKGDYSDQVSTGVDLVLVPRAARRRAPASRRSTSRPWCRCGCTRSRSPAATRSCSSRASATRPRRCSSPSCGQRPACPTASSTSCTATRRRSTRCSTTPTSPRCRSSAPRPIAQYIHEQATATGKRVQALGGAKNHAIVLPDADLDFAADQLVAAAFGSAGRALHGDLRRRRRRRRPATRWSTLVSEQGPHGHGRLRPATPAQRDGPGGHRRGTRPDRRADRRRRASRARRLVVDGRGLGRRRVTRTASSSARPSSTR